MSLSLSLSNALSGLQAAQASIATISNNITNVNTPGYSRQVQPQTSLSFNGVGSGVQSQTVIAQVDQFLNADITKETSVLGQANAVNKYLAQLQTLLGTPQQGSTIGNYYNTFSNSLTALAASPEDANLQTSVVRAAQNLTTELNGTSSDIQQIRTNAIADVGTSVSTINLDLTKIDTLNAQITRASALGQSTATLSDQRQDALNDLANYMDVTTFTRSTGDIAVYTRSGDVLVDNGARQLSYTPPSTVNSTTTVGSILLGGADITKGSLRGGYLAGLVDIVNNQLPSVTAQLNTFAQALYSQTIDPSGRLKTNSAAASGASTTLSAGADTSTTGLATFQADVQGTGFTAGQLISQTLAGPPPTTAVGKIVSSVPSQIPGYSTIVFTMAQSGGTLYGGPVSIGGALTGTTLSGGTSAQVIGLAALDATVVSPTGSGTATGSVAANGGVATIDFQSNTAVTVSNPYTGLPTWNGLVVTGVTQDPNNAGHQIVDVLNKTGAAISFNFNATYTGGTVLRVSGQNPVLNVGQFFSNVSLSPNDVPADAAGTITVNPALDATQGGSASKLNLQNDPNALNNSNYASISQTLANQLSNTSKVTYNATGSGALSIASAKYSVSDYLTAIISTNASQASAASNYYQFQNQYTSTLTTQAASVSGVNLDQELANLTLYQNSYAASAKVVSATSKLFDTLFTILP